MYPPSEFFGGEFGSSFVSVHKIVGMSKSSRMSSRSCTFAWALCVLLVHSVAIVRQCCVHPVGSLAIAFTSCGHRRHRAFSPHDGNTMGTWRLPMVSRRLHDVARPSHSHRVTLYDTLIVSRLDHDVIIESRMKVIPMILCININLNSNILEQGLSSMKLHGKRNRPHCKF